MFSKTRKYQTDPRSAIARNFIIKSPKVLTWDYLVSTGAYALYAAVKDGSNIYYVRYKKQKRLGFFKKEIPFASVAIRLDDHKTTLDQYKWMYMHDYKNVPEFDCAMASARYNAFISSYIPPPLPPPISLSSPYLLIDKKVDKLKNKK